MDRRGLAVVASEVKSLATQTSNATDEIRGQIAVFRAPQRAQLRRSRHQSDVYAHQRDFRGDRRLC
jgi:hypothetical protein